MRYATTSFITRLIEMGILNRKQLNKDRAFDTRSFTFEGGDWIRSLSEDELRLFRAILKMDDISNSLLNLHYEMAKMCEVLHTIADGEVPQQNPTESD